ncbi:hypothetical protein [Kribbella sp. CA-294648]|uniref:hypothetical protein n=1 Tax=Kribbella sp. CA-294648 TaxID=3239948 RepID=UPI003D9022D0
MKLKVRFAAVLALGLLAAGLVSAAPASGAPAPAAAPATISREIYLTGSTPVTGTVMVPASGPRRIYLAAATYAWHVTIDGVGRARNVSLRAGWYNWRCYLTGNGTVYPNYNYRGNCLLDPDAAGQANAWLPASGAINWAVPTGWHTWKSDLYML